MITDHAHLVVIAAPTPSRAGSLGLLRKSSVDNIPRPPDVMQPHTCMPASVAAYPPSCKRADELEADGLAYKCADVHAHRSGQARADWTQGLSCMQASAVLIYSSASAEMRADGQAGRPAGQSPTRIRAVASFAKLLVSVVVLTLVTLIATMRGNEGDPPDRLKTLVHLVRLGYLSSVLRRLIKSHDPGGDEGQGIRNTEQGLLALNASTLCLATLTRFRH